MEIEEIYKATKQLTPVELRDGIYFKRDDLFKPFGEDSVCGGKTRQAFTLVYNHRQHIETVRNKTLITASSVHSPQGIIVATLAKMFNWQSILCVGAIKPEHISKHITLRMARALGCDIRIVARMGMPNVVFSKANEIAVQNGYFMIAFGMNFKGDSRAIIETTANQVENLPDDLDTMVIPVGSGVTLGGILCGIVKFKKRIKRIVAIGVGPDRTQIARDICMTFAITKQISFYDVPKFDFISLYARDKFSYADAIQESYGGVDLDSTYEGKAFNCFIKELYKKDEKTLFWIVGNKDKLKETK